MIMIHFTLNVHFRALGPFPQLDLMAEVTKYKGVCPLHTLSLCPQGVTSSGVFGCGAEAAAEEGEQKWPHVPGRGDQPPPAGSGCFPGLRPWPPGPQGLVAGSQVLISSRVGSPQSPEVPPHPSFPEMGVQLHLCPNTAPPSPTASAQWYPLWPLPPGSPRLAGFPLGDIAEHQLRPGSLFSIPSALAHLCQAKQKCSWLSCSPPLPHGSTSPNGWAQGLLARGGPT